MVTADWLRCLHSFVVLIHLFFTGTSGIACYTTLESLDLGCLLRWDCPHASPNTTYSVQTKTKGDPWRDVSWCVWVSTHTCDLSQVFYNFEAYNLVRVGVHLSTSSTEWMQPRKFDSTDFSFSAPSVSLSLLDDQLLVKVQFPCGASKRCSTQRCCPITELINPLATVTLFNKLSEYQSRTVWTLETVLFVEFSGLAAGQNYCAVANFSFNMASSPVSSPQCIQTASHIGLLPLLYMTIALSLLLLVPFSGWFLQRPKRAAPPSNSSPPKSPPILADNTSLVPLSMMPADPVDIHIEINETGCVEFPSSPPSSLHSNHPSPSITILHIYKTPCWDSNETEYPSPANTVEIWGSNEN